MGGWPRFSVRRCQGGWSYTYTGRRCWGRAWSLWLPRAVWNAATRALGRGRWAKPDLFPNLDRVPIDDDGLTVALECECYRTFGWWQSDPLVMLDDRDGEPWLMCREHGWQPIWFTAGVLDPSPWYEDAPGMRILGDRLPVPAGPAS